MSPFALRRGVALALLLASSACASAPLNEPSATARRDPNVLLADELQASALGNGSLLEAVRRLRPNFLKAQGGLERGGTEQVVQVALGNGPPGPITLLEDLMANTVQSVVLLTPAQINLRYGMRETFGPVLLVTLKP